MNHIGEGVKMGRDVKVWHFSYIGDETVIGDGTSIGSLAHIDHHVRIGRNCRIQGMVYLPPCTVIGDNVFIGPGVILTNDPFPQSGKLKGVTIMDNAVICAAAVIRPGVVVGESSVIGMGAIVTRDVKPGSVVYGVPATHRYNVEEYVVRQETWINQAAK